MSLMTQIARQAARKNRLLMTKYRNLLSLSVLAITALATNTCNCTKSSPSPRKGWRQGYSNAFARTLYPAGSKYSKLIDVKYAQQDPEFRELEDSEYATLNIPKLKGCRAFRHSLSTRTIDVVYYFNSNGDLCETIKPGLVEQLNSNKNLGDTIRPGFVKQQKEKFERGSADFDNNPSQGAFYQPLIKKGIVLGLLIALANYAIKHSKANQAQN